MELYSSTKDIAAETEIALKHPVTSPNLSQPPPRIPMAPPEQNTAFKPEYYFFYGSLQDKCRLAKILERPERLDLQRATIVGWTYKMWGDYPALVPGSPGNTVQGMACEIKRITERNRLIQYETTAYKIQDCEIQLDRGTVKGKTFVWDGDPEALHDGIFDLKDWILNQLDIRCVEEGAVR
ncbi:hypothetical protein N7528_000923 [Penicillium herquei]|nr:hypothetical protein N7528_000923 [Penicillium herquei]